MEKTTAENAVNDTLKTIHQMAERVKQDKEASIGFMKIYEREQMLIKQGCKEEQANRERTTAGRRRTGKG